MHQHTTRNSANQPNHPPPCRPQTVGDATGVPPIYSLLATLRRLPYLSAHPPLLTTQLRAADAASAPVVTLGTQEPAARVLEVLTATQHNGFPVVEAAADGKGGSRLVGVVLRKHLLLLLGRRCLAQGVGGDGPLLNLTALQEAGQHNDHRYDSIYICV